MAGDYGFDPLGLGQDPARLKWYQEAELMNGRWAMMAVAGILFTSAMGFTDGKWYLTGAQEFPIPTLALLSIQFPVMGMLEAKRLDGYQATGGVRPRPPPSCRSRVVTPPPPGMPLHALARVVAMLTVSPAPGLCVSVGAGRQLPLRPHGHVVPGEQGEGGEERPSCYGATTARVAYLTSLFCSLS